MHRAELVEELTADILTYVMQGSVPEQHFVTEIKPAGLDQRFDEYEMLVRLHFLLKPEVVAFVEELPKRLREIKTQTANVSKRARGQVEGRINWTKTIRERNARAPGDTALFVYDDRTEDYDIAENVVLKQLLSLVYHTLDDCREYIEQEPTPRWVTDSWRENLELVDRFGEIFERNVHVTRIREPAEYEPTDRMLQRAERSRSTLYREATELLHDYRALLAADENALRDLLQSTAITPDDDSVLLELFVLFKYIAAIEDLRDGEFRLRTIEREKQEVARLAGGSDGPEIRLYHDKAADRPKLSFDMTPQGDDENSFNRYEMVQHESDEIARNYFSNSNLGSKTGRPDVIVVEARHDCHNEYLITEVKNSTSMQTIRSGITETLQYLAFLQEFTSEDEKRYVFGDETQFLGAGWNGSLVIQDLDEETASFEEQEDQRIKILQASEVEGRLQDILREVL